MIDPFTKIRCVVLCCVGLGNVMEDDIVLLIKGVSHGFGE